MNRVPLFSGSLALAFAANFFHGLAIQSYVHLPGFLRELGADELRIGILAAIMSGTAIVSRPLVGRLMDTRGRRLVVILGGGVNVAACLSFLLVRDLGLLLDLARLLQGLAQAMLFSVLFTIAADLIPAERRTEGFAIFGVSGMLSLTVGGLFGDVILARGEYTGFFLGTAGAALLGLLVTLPVTDSRPLANLSAPRRSFFAGALEPALRPLWLVTVLHGLAISAGFVFLKDYVLETDGKPVGMFFTAYSLTAIFLRLAFGWLPDRIGQKRTMIPAIACTALGLVLLATGAGTWQLLVGGMLGGVGHGFAFPTLLSLTVTRARPTERGGGVAAFTALFDTGFLVGGPLLGGIARIAGYPAMFVAAAILLTLATAGFAVWDRRRPD